MIKGSESASRFENSTSTGTLTISLADGVGGFEDGVDITVGEINGAPVSVYTDTLTVVIAPQ